MALKGKKKSRARGSQARRRPAAAPRPSYGGNKKARWYQTTAGLVIGFLIAATVIVFVWWWVADSRSDAQALETRQADLQSYTSNLRAVMQTLTPLASELGTAATLKDDELPKKAKEWKNQLAEVQTTLSTAVPPPELAPLSGLLAQSLSLYGQSIEQYELLPDLEGKTRDEISAKATASLSAGNTILTAVIQLLDAERQDADLSVSELTVPGAQEEITTPTEPLDTTGGGNQGGTTEGGGEGGG